MKHDENDENTSEDKPQSRNKRNGEIGPDPPFVYVAT